MLAVRVPFVVRRPEPCNEQDRELAQRCRKCALEADEIAEMTHAIGELRTAQQRVERAAQSAARSARDRVGDALLLGAHVLFGKGRETRLHGVVPCGGDLMRHSTSSCARSTYQVGHTVVGWAKRSVPTREAMQSANAEPVIGTAPQRGHAALCPPYSSLHQFFASTLS